MSCRKFASEYVANHLHGLCVVADLAATSIPAAVTIATHNGSFHCDEALACGLLRHTRLYHQSQVLRTRDPALIGQCDIAVDVGAVYDAEKSRLDHHQSSFHGTMTTDKKTYMTRLSSAGLVYKHYGKEIISDYLAAALASAEWKDRVLAMTRLPAGTTRYPETDIDTLFDAVYKNFVEQVDGIDNGVEPFSPAQAGEPMVKNYTQSTTLSDRVGKLQTWWNEPGNNDAALENALFVEAVEMTSEEFFAAVSYFAFSWLPARSLVVAAFDGAAQVHPSGQIVVFQKEFCPWKDHLVEIEEERGVKGQVLYVIFTDGKGGWRVQAVPKENSGFENRKPLPFKGLRDAELSAASGIDGGVFVHVSGFIGGMKTYEGAVALATKGLSM